MSAAELLLLVLVVATVTSVEEEIRRKGSRRYVTAVWIDTQTQHVYTFRSPLSLFVQNCSLAIPLRSALTPGRQTATRCTYEVLVARVTFIVFILCPI
jgi:hypothetical protein